MPEGARRRPEAGPGRLEASRPARHSADPVQVAFPRARTTRRTAPYTCASRDACRRCDPVRHLHVKHRQEAAGSFSHTEMCAVLAS